MLATWTHAPAEHWSVVHALESGSHEAPFEALVNPVHVCGFADVFTVPPL